MNPTGGSWQHLNPTGNSWEHLDISWAIPSPDNLSVAFMAAVLLAAGVLTAMEVLAAGGRAAARIWERFDGDNAAQEANRG